MCIDSNKQTILVFLVALVLLFSVLPVQAQKTEIVLTQEQRLARLERLLSSDNLRQQTQAMNTLRDEIAALREQVEQQTNELNSLKQRQRSLYQDMDRRINAMEMRGGASATTAAPVPPPNTAAGAPVLATGSAATAGDTEGKEAYSVAFGLLKEGKYQQSITEFEKFIQAYPQSQYADNAQYWLGEANYVSRKYKEALANFERLIAQFPESTKIPGAKLKVGYVYFELKNWSAAKEALQKVVKLYPGTTVAKKANERLERIKREGH